MEEDERYRKFNLLYKKSLWLIQEQYDSYKSTHGKTSTLIALSAFIFPIMLAFSNFKDYEIGLKYILSIPLLAYIISLVLFCIVLYSRELKYGCSFNKIEKQFQENSIDFLKYEIIALKLAFDFNSRIIKKQIKNFNMAIILTIFSICLLCIIFLIGHLKLSDKETTTKVKIENIDNFNNFN